MPSPRAAIDPPGRGFARSRLSPAVDTPVTPLGDGFRGARTTATAANVVYGRCTSIGLVLMLDRSMHAAFFVSMAVSLAFG